MKIKGLTAIFIATFFITFWINFIDLKFNTFWIFTDKAGKVESIIDNLCLSYIAGYIFYFINVYLVEKNEKTHIMPYVAHKVHLIISNNYSVIRLLKNDRKIKSHYPNVLDYYDLLDEKNLRKIKINLNNKELSFFEYLVTRKQITVQNIDKILTASKYVDEELKSILYKLSESLLLNENTTLNKENFDIKTFKKYKLVFEKYFDMIQILDEYYQKNLHRYFIPLSVVAKVKK